MATTKKRRAPRSLAERARDPNEQRRSAFAEIAQFHVRIDAALVLAGYDDAPEDARLAGSFLDGAAQALRDGDTARAFRCGIVARDLLVRLEAASGVRRATALEVQSFDWEVKASELEDRDLKSAQARYRARRAEPADVVREVESRLRDGAKTEAAYAEVGQLLALSPSQIKKIYLHHRK